MKVGVTGDTRVITQQGQKPISKLLGQRVKVWTGFEWSEVDIVLLKDSADTVNLTFTWAKMVTVGVDTKFKLKDGTVKKAKELNPYECLDAHAHPSMGGMQPNLFVMAVDPAGERQIYAFKEPKSGTAVFNDVLAFIDLSEPKEPKTPKVIHEPKDEDQLSSEDE